MFFKIAWRNVWVNKRRSILTLLLSILCVTFLIFVFSFHKGTYGKMFRDAIEVYTGYIQITGQGYNDSPDQDHLIFNVKKVEAVVKENADIEYFGTRFESFGLFSADMDSVGGIIIGIEPDKEPNISRMKKSIQQGRFLKEDDYGKALIGNKLAKKLQVGIGDTITYLSSAVDQSMAADIVEIVGIFYTSSEFDSAGMFVNKAYMDDIFYSYGSATHMIVYPKKKSDKNLDKVVMSLSEDLKGENLDVVTWKVPLKSLVSSLQLDFAFGLFSYSILVIVIFFVIMIFTMLAVLQRTKEIGVLRAIGNKPMHIFQMIAWEALILGVISAVVGAILGGALAYYFQVNPINMEGSREMMDQYNLSGMVDLNFPTLFSWITIMKVSLFMVGLNLLAVVYPVWKVNKYKPIEAINYV